MNTVAIDKLKCIMVLSMSKKLLNEKWGSECNVDKLEDQAKTAAAFLWLLEQNCTDTIDINLLGAIEKFTNSPNDTAYQCNSVQCEEKAKTIPCSGITISVVSDTPCSFLIEDITS